MINCMELEYIVRGGIGFLGSLESFNQASACQDTIDYLCLSLLFT